LNINKIQQQFNIDANYCVSVRYSYACSKITELLYYEELEKDGYSFFLQIDEEGYRKNMEYVFMYGALFLYKHNVTGNIIAGFWQYS